MECELAVKYGFQVRKETINHGLAPYLRIIVPEEDIVGAIKLEDQTGDYYCILHRDTKGRGGWQSSLFRKDRPCDDYHHMDLQSALDHIRERGFSLVEAAFRI